MPSFLDPMEDLESTNQWGDKYGNRLTKGMFHTLSPEKQKELAQELASRQFELVTNSNYEGMMSFIQNFLSDYFEVIPNLMQNAPVGDSIEPLKMGNISHSEDIQIQDINLGENDNVIVELN